MRLSILDYVPIFEDRSAHEAFQHSVELAQRAEQLGYMRYWVAEHHQVRSVASSAPEMVMMSLLEQTKKIRIGSGGVMLPHYSPYKVAEQFKIMEARHPRRVDMAIGRSPSFKNVNAALNENKEKKLDFETQLDDLNKYFSDNIDDAHRFKSLLATPLIPTAPEMYILGMSERSAKLAGRRGLPFVIAQMGQSSKSIDEVIKVYRDEFERWHGRYGGKSDEDVSDSFVGKIGEILEPDVSERFDADSEGRQMMEGLRKILWDMHVKGLRKVLVRFYTEGMKSILEPLYMRGLRNILAMRNHM